MISKGLEEIIQHLKKDIITNCNIIHFAESYPITYYKKIGEAVILKGISDRPWVYISCRNKEELTQIKAELSNDDKNFAIIEDWMIPVLVDEENIKWRLSCNKLYLPSDVEIPINGFATHGLTAEDAETIYYNSDYKEFLSIEYIKDRINKGIGSCIKVDGQPVAWAITQDDGAIGFLHSLPEYRGKGFAKAITIDIINKLRIKDMLPFVHIEENNIKSSPLAQSLGFKFDRKINWYEVV